MLTKTLLATALLSVAQVSFAHTVYSYVIKEDNAINGDTVFGSVIPFEAVTYEELNGKVPQKTMAQVGFEVSGTARHLLIDRQAKALVVDGQFRPITKLVMVDVNGERYYYAALSGLKKNDYKVDVVFANNATDGFSGGKYGDFSDRKVNIFASSSDLSMQDAEVKQVFAGQAYTYKHSNFNGFEFSNELVKRVDSIQGIARDLPDFDLSKSFDESLMQGKKVVSSIAVKAGETVDFGFVAKQAGIYSFCIERSKRYHATLAKDTTSTIQRNAYKCDTVVARTPGIYKKQITSNTDDQIELVAGFYKAQFADSPTKLESMRIVQRAKAKSLDVKDGVKTTDSY